MPQFRRFTTMELIDYTKHFAFTRPLTQLHVHHTYSPSHKDFNGNNYDAIQQGMKNYHMRTNRWSDIAQQLTLFPDGIWVYGRPFNQVPASILGWNTGAFCIEMLGNFDRGNDYFIPPQSTAMYEFCEFMVEEKGLAMKFHRDSPTAYKTCPGTGIDRAQFFDNVSNFTSRKEIKSDQEEKEAAQKRVMELKRIMERVHTMFKDMINSNGEPHWSTEYVNFLVEKGIVKGTKDASGDPIFQPNNNITRAEVATLLAKTYQSIEELIHSITNKK